MIRFHFFKKWGYRLSPHRNTTRLHPVQPAQGSTTALGSRLCAGQRHHRPPRPHPDRRRHDRPQQSPTQRRAPSEKRQQYLHRPVRPILPQHPRRSTHPPPKPVRFPESLTFSRRRASCRKIGTSKNNHPSCAKRKYSKKALTP